MDWNSPPIYDPDVNDENLMEISYLSCDEKVIQNWDTHHF
jgi:hypothetical protein